MFVIKRNGQRVELRTECITDRNIELSKDLDINVDYLSQLVIQSLKSDMTTSEISELIAETAAYMSVYEPDYDTLATRISISNLYKATLPSFYETVKIMYNSQNAYTGKQSNIISTDFFNFVEQHHQLLDSALDYSRDKSYSYFGFKTLQRIYLIKLNGKIVERPQHMIMRVAIAVHLKDKNIHRIIETYNEMSSGKFTHASPTLFNSGSEKGNLSSCFLLHMDDSMEHIYETNKRCALISKHGGGIGIDISSVRAKGSPIHSTNGESDGILPMCRVLNSTCLYANQSSRRKGSFAVYLQPWHPDVFEFLALRLNNPPEELRARDLFLAMWIPDIFMERVEKDEMWSLFCPTIVPNLTETYGKEFESIYINAENQKLFAKQVKARDVWKSILQSQTESGLPYILYKDSINNKSNQKNIGIIRSSNLCVSGDTKILTKEGHIPINELVNKKVEIWNGFEWSEVEPKQTGKDVPLLQVELNNGVIINCTEYHKFPIITNYQDCKLEKVKFTFVDAKDLKQAAKLIKYYLPIIEGDEKYDMNNPYTNGAFCGDGTYEGSNKDIPRISLYGEKIKLIPYLSKLYLRNFNEKQNRQDVMLPLDLETKYTVPSNKSTIKCKLRWLAGLADTDGTVSKNGSNLSLIISSIYNDFLLKIKEMLQTIGIDSRIGPLREEGERLLPNGKGGKSLYHCQTYYRLIIPCSELQDLFRLGFKTYRLNFDDFNPPNRQAKKFVQIKSVKVLSGLHDTYCFTESKRNLGMFNGVILGNCTEIVEFTSPDSVSVCNLSSIALPRFIKDGVFDLEELGRIVKIIVRNLNNIIDTNFYPVEEAKNNNLKYRPIGIGVQGLADVFAILKMPWESSDAKITNRLIFETIYYFALEASAELAQEDGCYEGFEGSPISQGILQYHMWNSTPLTPYNWDELIEKCKKGVRNSLLIAAMPTASTSQILGWNECFEPFTSNIYSRSTLAGNFIMVNKHLYSDLKLLGLWNKDIVNNIIENNGSVEKVKEIPENIKQIYKTVWEISQKIIIDFAADRGAFIDQSQSMNIFIDHPTQAKLSSMHLYGWKKGLKTGSYYIRSKPARDAIKFTILKEKSDVKDVKPYICTSDVCVGCSS